MPGYGACDPPWKIPAKARGTACDFVYSGGRTPFLEEASSRGLRPIGGLDILVHQALASWELWVGALPEKETFKRAIMTRLRARR
jgi:shikimate 5-dehydrogenase